MALLRLDPPGLSLGIKSFTEKQVQVMEGQGEFAKSMRCVLVMQAAFHFSADALKAFAEGEGFVRLAESSQQTFHGIGLAQRGADELSSFADFDVTGFDALEQETFELATILRALGIDFTFAAGKSGAGLPEFFDAGPGFASERQPERAQPPGIILRAQLHIGENHPIAAQAAFTA
jgi:hypothetical protein